MELLNQKIYEDLVYLYGNEVGNRIFNKLVSRIKEVKKNIDENHNYKNHLFSQKDIILITYGNSIIENGEKPLKTFLKFLKPKRKKLTLLSLQFL